MYAFTPLKAKDRIIYKDRIGLPWKLRNRCIDLTLSGGNNDDDKRGAGDGDKAGMGPLYRIGKHKFRLDGKDGKTLDDVIEVQAVLAMAYVHWM